MNWTAFDCGGDGIALTGGAFDLVHATSVGNAGIGIERSGSHSGGYLNSIAFSNAGGNFAGMAAADVSHCNGDAGFAGPDGNLFADPLFVDEAAGDLRLGAGSPCVEAGAPTAELEDAAEFPRALDGDGDGLLEPDMGAHERASHALAVTGEARLGTVLALRVDGEPGLAAFGLGLLDGSLVLPPFGAWLAGDFSKLFVLGTAPIGADFPLPLPAPDPGLEGFEAGIQGLALPLSGAGSFTNLYRPRLFN